MNKLTNGKGPNKDIFLSMIKKMDDKVHEKYNLPKSQECSGGVQDLCIVTAYYPPIPTKLTNSQMIFVFNKKFEELKELGIQNTVVEVYDYVYAQIENSSQFFARLVWVEAGIKKAAQASHLYLKGRDDSVLVEIYKRDTDGAAYFMCYTEKSIPYAHYFLPTETNPEKYFDFNTVDFWNYDETKTGYIIGHITEFDNSDVIISDTKLDAQVYMDETADIHFANVSGGKSMIYTNFSGGFHIILAEYGEDPIGK